MKKKKFESIHYKHECKYYVPCFQKGNTFEYSMGDATQDQQMAASFYPDYILELHGTFDAKTKEKKK